MDIGLGGLVERLFYIYIYIYKGIQNKKYLLKRFDTTCLHQLMYTKISKGMYVYTYIHTFGNFFFIYLFRKFLEDKNCCSKPITMLWRYELK